MMVQADGSWWGCHWDELQRLQNFEPAHEWNFFPFDPIVYKSGRWGLMICVTGGGTESGKIVPHKYDVHCNSNMYGQGLVWGSSWETGLRPWEKKNHIHSCWSVSVWVAERFEEISYLKKRNCNPSWNPLCIFLFQWQTLPNNLLTVCFVILPWNIYYIHGGFLQIKEVYLPHLYAEMAVEYDQLVQSRKTVNLLVWTHLIQPS
jgi:hypothetical protein